MIDLITRVRYMDLYDQMIASAHKMADGQFQNHYELDTDGNPNVAETETRLGLASDCELLCFVEDDVEFISRGWDRIVEELYVEYRFDILGVLGSKLYFGGNTFDAGNEHGVGQVAMNHEGGTFIKVLSPYKRYQPVQVVEGFIFFIPKKLLIEKPFDPAFDGIFFSDTDLCLRCETVAVTSSILVKHSTKPADRVGVYSSKVRPIEDYLPILHQKHGLTPRQMGDRRCAMVSLDEYQKKGQSEVHRSFKEKFLCKSPS